MDNEAGDDDDDEGDYSSYNIVSKRRLIEQNSDGSDNDNSECHGQRSRWRWW
jgi:hypothetical protein